MGVLGIVVALWPLCGCQYICTDSRAESYGRNWIPFGRRYHMCNQSHCRDRNGNHLDARCSCSKNCRCWGSGGETADAGAAPAGGCCGGAS
jgi:hypothetical protein